MVLVKAGTPCILSQQGERKTSTQTNGKAKQNEPLDQEDTSIYIALTANKGKTEKSDMEYDPFSSQKIS